MSFYYMEHGEPEIRDFSKDGKTKQAFKDETDIDLILARFQVSGAVSHMAKFEPQYGDFADFDFLDAQLNLNKGLDIFDSLPSEIRREFNQSPQRFFDFVNDPVNKEKLDVLLPTLAEPGSYFLDGSSRTPPGTLVENGEPGLASEEVVSAEPDD